MNSFPPGISGHEPEINGDEESIWERDPIWQAMEEVRYFLQEILDEEQPPEPRYSQVTSLHRTLAVAMRELARRIEKQS